MKRRSVELLLVAVLAAAALPGALSAAEPKPAVAAGADIPEPLKGRWMALSTTAMGITHDVELSNGQFRTTRGAVPIALKPAEIPGFPGRAWITPMDARVVKILANGNRLCGGLGNPETVRWVLLTYTPKAAADGDDHIEIFPYQSEAPPKAANYDQPGSCGSLWYSRRPPGQPLK